MGNPRRPVVGMFRQHQWSWQIEQHPDYGSPEPLYTIVLEYEGKVRGSTEVSTQSQLEAFLDSHMYGDE